VGENVKVTRHVAGGIYDGRTITGRSSGFSSATWHGQGTQPLAFHRTRRRHPLAGLDEDISVEGLVLGKTVGRKPAVVRTLAGKTAANVKRGETMQTSRPDESIRRYKESGFRPRSGLQGLAAYWPTRLILLCASTNSKTWTEILANIATFVGIIFGIIGAIYVIRQWHLANSQWRFQRYDKLYAVYRANGILSNAVLGGRLSNQLMSEYARDVMGHDFLVGPEIHAFYDELYSQANILLTCESLVKNERDSTSQQTCKKSGVDSPMVCASASESKGAFSQAPEN